jgi:protease IV
MSEPQFSPSSAASPSQPAAPMPPPTPIVAKPPSASVAAGAARFSLLNVALTFSFLFNCLAVLVLAIVCFGVLTLKGSLDPDSLANSPLNETVHSGSATAKNKIAIVEIDGVIMEGLLHYPHKQIEQAVEDDHVKAVVLRINSPGGSITASDDLHRRIVNLRDGKTPGKNAPMKPVIVSMGSLAASGGYYIAAPGQTLLAERTTMTGSIGVYSAFPNVYGLAKDHGVSMITIKQGQIKDSGSPFKEMSEQERRVWQDMVDHAYLEFIHVVETGRPQLKDQLLKEFTIAPTPEQEKLHHPEPKGSYKRYLADGGIYTADKALEKGLIDQIGYLDDAIAVAQKAAGLGSDFKVIQYEKPMSLVKLLLNLKAKAPNTGLLDPGQVKNGFVPRLWYLMPGSEISGILAGMETPENP